MATGMLGELDRALEDLARGIEALIGGGSHPDLVAELLRGGATDRRAEPGAGRSHGRSSPGRCRWRRRAARAPRVRLVLVK